MVLRVALLVAVLGAIASGVAGDSLRAISGDVVTVKVGSGTFSVVDYGSKGDGTSDDTGSIQKALDAAAQAGGGTVTFPAPGRYLSTSIEIGSSHTEINVESGAVLLIDNDRGADGWKDKKDFITASATYTNLAFTGNGVIDGQGQVWWQHRDDFRPRCLYVHGSNVYMENLTWKDCPNHNLEMYTDTTEINNITILAPPSTHVSNPSHNTDGIDVHGSPFYIHNTYINTGDDNVAFHANDTLVEDCVFGTGHGASVGSIGTGTWIQNITVRNVQFKGTTTACRIKTDHGADGAVRDITYDSLTMEGVGTTIDVNMFYSAVGAHSSGGSMTISHITFSNIKADKSGSPGEFNCGDGGCDDILLDNVVHTATPGEWVCKDAKGSTEGDVTPPSCLSLEQL